MPEQRVFLVNPASKTLGYSLIAPRWPFVLAGATPADLGKPTIIDETIVRFDPAAIRPGDIVGIGITTGNCRRGYDVARQAKERGAVVVMGGIHATIYPDEALEAGADSVVTGDGDLAWERVLTDIFEGKPKRQYDGGRVPGNLMQSARWDLLNPAKYMFPSVQTVAGCPENCTFCSVWTINGREPRQRLAEKIIREVNDLYGLGFRFVVFADDNFNPATLGRIAREPSAKRRKEFERIRKERLEFFREYRRSVPKDMYGFTQMTVEIATDPEYLEAMHRDMGIRAALIGVESFSKEGLEAARKTWNPTGERMVKTIQAIQKKGIFTMSSIICGLEDDTPETIGAMREFAKASGTVMAQFTLYSPYPGTVDFLEMRKDRELRAEAAWNPLAQTPKHLVEILYDGFWKDPNKPAVLIKHPHMSAERLLSEIRASWKSFYSPIEIIRRARRFRWPRKIQLLYFLGSLAFYSQYAGYGIAADSVKEKQAGWLPKLLLKIGIGFYNRHFRKSAIAAEAK